MIGTTLSHFEITAKLGEGGMGEVYLATDTKLGREVAIKVLPEELTRDAERLARFEREAKVLASLSHTTIAAIHEIGEQNGRHFLVMEMADGEDLSARIARGPIPPDEAVPIALQIAKALDAAHAQGIIHRDLKPANVKVTAEGRVKVLDFGLAKAMETPGPGGDQVSIASSPTITQRMTGAGVIMGTAAYMSPEQAKGLEADRRADIWSFGVLLWEMLVGSPLFRGESVTDTLAAVLRDEFSPDSSLPDETPQALRALLTRCLNRDPRSRLQDIGEARITLAALEAGGQSSLLFAEAPEERSAEAPPAPRRRLPWLIAALAIGAAAVMAFLWLRTPTEPALPLFSSLTAPPEVRLGADDGIAFSPDGSRLAYVAVDADNIPRLWVQTLTEPEPIELEGTEGATYPFWSPDGAQLGFFADRQLKRIPAQGGAVQTLAPTQDARGGSWGPDGRIVYSPDFRAGLRTIQQSGGTPTELTQRDEARGELSHRFPHFLPGGRYVLFLAQTDEGRSRKDDSTIEVVDLSTGERTAVLGANSSMAYAPSGHLLYWHQGSLMAQAFDLSERRVAGDPILIAPDVAYSGNEFASFSVSQNGRLALQRGYGSRRQTRLSVVDRQGQPLTEPTELGTYLEASVSHDGGRAAYSDGKSIWTLELARGTSSRLTFEDGDHFLPLWWPDDEWIVYTTDRSVIFETFRLPASGRGAEERLATTEGQAGATDISPDGGSLLFYRVHPETDFDVEVFSVEGQSFEPLVRTRFFESLASFSPDGQWAAYTSSETGRFEVSILPLTGAGSKYAVSSAGGVHPVWSPRGDELFFLNLRSELMAVDVTTTAGGLEIGSPQRLFSIRQVVDTERPFAPMPDGESFLVNQREQGTDGGKLTLIQNWQTLAGTD